jgi:hypothetical protein
MIAEILADQALSFRAVEQLEGSRCLVDCGDPVRRHSRAIQPALPGELVDHLDRDNHGIAVLQDLLAAALEKPLQPPLPHRIDIHEYIGVDE